MWWGVNSAALAYSLDCKRTLSTFLKNGLFQQVHSWVPFLCFKNYSFLLIGEVILSAFTKYITFPTVHWHGSKHLAVFGKSQVSY